MTKDRLNELNKWDELKTCAHWLVSNGNVAEHYFEILYKNDEEFAKDIKKIRDKYEDKYTKLLKEA